MTPLEKLKALAAAKKQQGGQDVRPSVQEPEVAANHTTEPVRESSEVQEVAKASTVCDAREREVQTSEPQVPDLVQHDAVVETSPALAQGTDHPLVMELAELERALTEKLPDFRTILRDIHQKLRQDPSIVTVMSDEEIGLVISGLATHANAEIVAPKAAKAAKSAVAEAKKAARGPVSASDL